MSTSVNGERHVGSNNATWARNVKVPDGRPASDVWDAWKQKTRRDPYYAASLQGRVTTTQITAPPLGFDADINSIEEALMQWVEQAEEGENRGPAKDAIMDFLRNSRLKDIQLVGYKLKSLPDIWHVKVIADRLKIINLEDNQLKFLPRTFCELESLEYLSLANNDLQVLPRRLSNLTRLEWLGLANNPSLKSIPALNEDCTIKLTRGDLSMCLEKTRKIYCD